MIYKLALDRIVFMFACGSLKPPYKMYFSPLLSVSLHNIVSCVLNTHNSFFSVGWLQMWTFLLLSDLNLC